MGEDADGRRRLRLSYFADLSKAQAIFAVGCRNAVSFETKINETVRRRRRNTNAVGRLFERRRK